MLAPLTIPGHEIICRRCRRPYLLPHRRGILPACPSCGASPRPLRHALKHNGLAAVTSLLAAAVLGLSMRFPFITMIKLGDERSFSLPGGIYELYKDGDVFLAAILLSFSVIFPFAKLLCLLLATSSLVPFSSRARRVLHKLADLTGKYSMLDVLVVAISIVVVKFNAIAEVHARAGTYLFCVAVGLSILASAFVHHARFHSIHNPHE